MKLMLAQLMTSWCAAERRRPSSPIKTPGGEKDAGLDPTHRADRQAETKDVPDLGPTHGKGGAQHMQTRQTRQKRVHSARPASISH